MIRYHRCPVCESAAIHKIFEATDHTVSGESFEIFQCAHCSLRFTQDVPPAEHIGRYYKSENYISHTESDKGLINRLYLRVRKLTLSLKKNFIEEVTRKKKGAILDVGAGTGAFLHHMQLSGWNGEGVEPDAQAVKRAAEHNGLTLKPSSELLIFPIIVLMSSPCGMCLNMFMTCMVTWIN